MTPADLALVIEAEDLTIEAGLDLLDADDSFIEDITDDFVADGSSVSHDEDATIHGTATLRISRELQWGFHRVRPRMRLSSETLGLGFSDDDWVHLGVYVMPTPVLVADDDVYEVACYDKLQVLTDPLGRTATAEFGTLYLDDVQALIADAGEAPAILDPTSTATLPTGRAWLITEDPTSLGVVNDLLSTVAYRGLYADREGDYRSEPDVSPATVAPSWTFNTGSLKTTMGQDRSLTGDFFEAPNRWVFINNDPLLQDDSGLAMPIEGLGLYTVVNQSDGPTSIDERRGRVVSKVVHLSAANQPDLVTQGDRIVEDDKRLPREITCKAGPMPVLWHRNTVAVTDAALGVNDSKFSVPRWTLPFNGDDMDLTMREVA